MQEQKKVSWKRQFKGNNELRDVKNPLRNYIENQIKKIDLTSFPQRPVQKIDLSIGDPTKSVQFQTKLSNLDIIGKHVGKIDGYTDFRGIEKARQILAQKYSNQTFKLNKDQVFLTAGGSMCIWYTAVLLCNPGDNILFPSPGFPLLLSMSKVLKVTPRFYTLKADKNWEADLNELESLIDQKTKFIYIIDPSNPLGSCWSSEHKRSIIEISDRKGVPILADEIYEQVSDNPMAPTFPQLATEKSIIFKLSGLTKKWFGPGWRLGWLVVFGNQERIQPYLKGLKRISNVFLMPNTIMQSALSDIINNKQNTEHLASRTAIMKKTQQMCVDELKDETYCSVTRSSGALYLAIVIHIDKFKPEQIKDCRQLCKKLYAQENIMIFPGQFFSGKTDFIRLVISCSTSKVQEFVVRFKRFAKSHLL